MLKALDSVVRFVNPSFFFSDKKAPFLAAIAACAYFGYGGTAFTVTPGVHAKRVRVVRDHKDGICSLGFSACGI